MNPNRPGAVVKLVYLHQKILGHFRWNKLSSFLLWKSKNPENFGFGRSLHFHLVWWQVYSTKYIRVFSRLKSYCLLGPGRVGHLNFQAQLFMKSSGFGSGRASTRLNFWSHEIRFLLILFAVQIFKRFKHSKWTNELDNSFR